MGESQLFEIGLETDPNLGSRSQTPRAGLACVSLGGFGFPLLERVLTPASNPWVSRKTESKGAWRWGWEAQILGFKVLTAGGSWEKKAAVGTPPPCLLTPAPKGFHILALGPISCFVGKCILYLCDGENRRGEVHTTQEAAEENGDISAGDLRHT